MNMNHLRAPAFMAFLLTAAILIGQHGCSSSEMFTVKELKETITLQSGVMRDCVIRFVQDPSRRDKLLVLIDELEKEFQEHNRNFEAFMDSFQLLFCDHDTSREAMEKALREYKATRQKARERILELHYEMVALTTAEEWEKAVEYELKALEAAYNISNVETKG